MKSFTKLILIILVSVLVFLGLYFIGLKPRIAKISERNAELVRKNQELETLKQQIELYRTAKRELQQAEGKENIVDALPEAPGLLATVQDMENALDKSSALHTLNIRDEFVDKPVIPNPPGVVQVNYNLEAVGSFKDMIDFLRYFENIPHLSELLRIDFSPHPESKGALLGNFKGIFYVKKP